VSDLIRFLLAKLYMTSLSGKQSPNAVRKALEAISIEARTKRNTSDVKIYDYAYETTMERIEEYGVNQSALAKETLTWITCAEAPLEASDLRRALGMRVGASAFDYDDCPDSQDMISVCAGLVTLDEGSGVIRLVHYTTQEYLSGRSSNGSRTRRPR
jgi:hypothetical protein